MKIVLCSALFPPDIAPPAPYVKELARRLTPLHEILVTIYGRLPEQVPGASMIAIDKRRPLPLRLMAFTAALWRAARDADVLLAENSPAIELPLLVLMPFLRAKIIVHVGDDGAKASRGLRRLLQRSVQRRADAIVAGSPLPRPEILPFAPRPETQLARYEASWQEHLQTLEKLFTHAIR